jgi:hypothetical protein
VLPFGASCSLCHNLYIYLPSGKLDKVAVLKAICSGFEETTEPAICLSEGLQCFLFTVNFLLNLI